MATPSLCTEAEVTQMVHRFYALIRQDAVLGPIFESHIDDWDAHLEKLVDFWSSILRRTARFSGTPMPRHVALPDLSAELFQRWLMLFRQSNAGLANQAMAEQANATAQRIAQSLWLGYQMNHFPDRLARGLEGG
jgi:hemoglobin